MRAIKPHQFRRSATDIEQDDAARCRIEQLGAAGRRESRFGGGIDDFKFEPGFFRHSRAKLLAVFGGAASRRSDQARPAYAAGAHFLAADQKRLDGAHDCRLADAPGGGDTFAEADNAGECIDDAKAIGGRTRHQQAAIICAKIERRISRSVM
jgi:hypothetical protein